MRHLSIIGLFVSAICFSGCFTSSFPLDSPKASEMDLTLEGVWEPVNPDPDDGPSSLRIMAFNEGEYYVEFQEDTVVADVPLVKPERLRMRAFLTTIGGVRFANVQEIGTDDKDYMFARVDLGEGILTIQSVGTELTDEVEFDTPEEMVAFFRSHADDDELYEDDVTHFRRQE